MESGSIIVDGVGAASAFKSQITKDLRKKANDFLNARRNANNLVDIIGHLEKNTEENQPTAATALILEVVFTELFKRNEMRIVVTPLKPIDENPENQYRQWLLERYEETLALLLHNIENAKVQDATQALVTCMKLFIAEAKRSIDSTDTNALPLKRLRNILEKLVTAKRSQTMIIQRYKEYAEYLDVVYFSWKAMQFIGNRAAFTNETFACNFIELLHYLPVTATLQENHKLLFYVETIKALEYSTLRRYINKIWCYIMQWSNDVLENVHKQMLILLLERIMPHLDKPILLTDFLMDSLDCGGPVSLLALQGIFTLIHKHNVIYPNIYEKLYSMFEPEIFYTKFKARLFYLADIFLTSTHLPENLVAAFVKRLARLSLVAPPQDVIIILYFIGNLILRHPGLKRLICAQAAVEVSRDPYIMDERDPIKSNALESSLWEIVLLQKHALPEVASAARFISQPLPTTEWDLSSVLELNESDVFDQELAKQAKQFAIRFERPQSLFLPKNDKVKEFWKLF